MTKVNQTNEISKETIRDAVREYCSAKTLSQNELAVKSGVSGATINKVLNGKWNDISEVMWRKLWNAVNDGQNEMFISTRDHSATQQICKVARSKKLMVGLIGDTGMGKTTSLKLMSRQRHTYYVVYDKTMRAKQFFVSILREMGIAFDGSIYEMVNRIAEELNVISSPLLIIDESGKITHNVTLYMHVLRDKTNSNCGIVLAGMPYFKTNLQKMSNKQKEGMAEFFRRINVWHELQGLTRAEIEFICNNNGITDKEDIRAFYSNKRFGDLVNAILLHQTQFFSSPINE